MLLPRYISFCVVSSYQYNYVTTRPTQQLYLGLLALSHNYIIDCPEEGWPFCFLRTLKKIKRLMFECFQESTWTTIQQNESLFIALEQQIIDHPMHTILSIGCSRGFEIDLLLRIYPSSHIFGFDINPCMTKICQQRFHSNSRVTILQQVGNLTFDLVICINVLYTIPEPPSFKRSAKAINTLYSMVSCNGYLLIYGANHRVQDILQNCIFHKLHHIGTGIIQVFDKCGNKIHLKSTPLVVEKYNDSHRKILTATSDDVQEVVKSRVVQMKPNIFTIGILAYGLSCNIGDYIQTLAQINILSTFYNKEWVFPSEELREIFEYFAKLKPDDQQTSRSKNIDGIVHIVWVYRDKTWAMNESMFPSTPIYCIMNGWFMHKFKGRYQFPFPTWLHPFLVSMHFTSPDILQSQEACKYLIKHGPVGCRDTDTMKMLQGHNIPAYFSGCLTSTLQCDKSKNNRTQHIAVDVQDHEMFTTSLQHSQEILKTLSADQCIVKAFQIFEFYAVHAKCITTSRLHCILPAYAIGIQTLIFQPPNLKSEVGWFNCSRFTGLIDIMNNTVKRNILSYVLFGKLQLKFDRVLIGQCQQGFPVANKNMIVKNDQSEAIRLSHPQSIIVNKGSQIDLILKESNAYYHERDQNQAKVHYIIPSAPFQSFIDNIDILVTFDENYVNMFFIWLHSLSASNNDYLCRVFCCTRNISHTFFNTNVRSRCYHLPNVVIYWTPSNTDFTLYSSPHEHINVCCMDRLTVTEMIFQLNDDLNRIIYMDLDVIVTGQIHDLMKIDTGLMGIAAKLNKENNIQKWINQYKLELKTDIQHHFNAGVLVMDIHKLRQQLFWEFVCDIVSQYPIHDELILNLYCDGKSEALDNRYNIIVSRDDHKFPNHSGLVYHFAGKHKPWKHTRENYMHDKYLWDLWHNVENKNAC
jgi:lipopolysaccharide biosynthesis glycosyltransferase